MSKPKMKNIKEEIKLFDDHVWHSFRNIHLSNFNLSLRSKIAEDIEVIIYEQSWPQLKSIILQRLYD